MAINTSGIVQAGKLSTSFKRLEPKALKQSIRLPKTHSHSTSEVLKLRTMFDETQFEENKTNWTLRVLQWTGIITMAVISSSLFVWH